MHLRLVPLPFHTRRSPSDMAIGSYSYKKVTTAIQCLNNSYNKVKMLFEVLHLQVFCLKSTKQVITGAVKTTI